MQNVFYIAFPYFAVIVAIGAGLYRYFYDRYSYSSLSSQLLENRKLFWGSVPWHYGITLILLAHVLAWLFPGAAALIFASPLRLLVFEMAGLALALYSLFGLVVLIVRRLPTDSRPRAVTSAMDWVLLFFLLVQVATGIAVALFNRWGAQWYLSTAAPWLWSLITFRPDPSTISATPALIQLHVLLGFCLILLFPFTRLVHIFTIPLDYLWRPYQVVIWNQDPRRREELVVFPSLPPAEPDDPGRRDLLAKAGVLAGAIGAVIIGVPSIGFLLGLRKAPAVWRQVGKVEDFTVGATVQVSFLDPSPEPWAGVTARTAAWLRRQTEQDFLVFAVNCTHLGCPVRWLPDANLFMCPCHGGVYYQDGTVASGPPPRPLVTYPVRVQDGMVEILAGPLPIMS